MFFFQFVVMMGLFFVIPLYLSVALGLSAIDTGIKITPLSVTMLLAAAGDTEVLPGGLAAARRRDRVRGGGGRHRCAVQRDGRRRERADRDGPVAGDRAGAWVALASQLGAVTVSAVPDEQSPEVGGLQNTATQFGASLGTALAGSVLIAALTASFLTGIAENPDVPQGGRRRKRTCSSRAASRSSPTPTWSGVAGGGRRRQRPPRPSSRERRGAGGRAPHGPRAPRVLRRGRAVLHEADPDRQPGGNVEAVDPAASP